MPICSEKFCLLHRTLLVILKNLLTNKASLGGANDFPSINYDRTKDLGELELLLHSDVSPLSFS